MKYFIIFLALFGFLFFLPSVLENSADACQYIKSDNTLQEDFDTYDFIFSGKILKVEEYATYMPVTLEIIEQWKGQSPEKILLFTCKGENDGGLRFQDGESYLIFAEKLNSAYPIVTDFGPTKLLSEAKNEILFLDQKSNITRFHYDNPVQFSLSSPLKQFKSEISVDNIQCNSHRILIQKYDGSPACVKPETKKNLIERGWTTKDDSISKTSTNCMTPEQSKETAPFFKTPSYLPEGYSHVCSQSGTPSESYIVYHNQEIQYWNIPELISDGAIFIHQIDERSMLGEQKVQAYGSPEQRIQETYDSVMDANPSLNPQLITINGMLAYAVDSCNNCGMQIANFTDGTSIQKSTSTETKIKFIDENGVTYMLKTTLPLSELVKVAESLQ